MLRPEMQRRNKYRASGVLATNGKIYFAPRDAHQVLSIDPETQTVEMLEPRMWNSGLRYFAAGVLASNGKIYVAPCEARQVLSIDP